MSKASWQCTVQVALWLTLWLSRQHEGAAFLLLPVVVATTSSSTSSDQQRNGHDNSHWRRRGPTTTTSTAAALTRRRATTTTPLWLANGGDQSVAVTRKERKKNNDQKKKKKQKQRLANITIVGIDDTNDNRSDSKKVKQRRRNNKEQRTKEDFEARVAAWEAKYGSAQALCRTFGGCSKSFWGDLSGEDTRQLYHTLLPRSLWALQEADILQPEALAPLAYQARVAAKEYARMRSNLPSRMLAMAFDGYRSWKRNGNPLNTKGLTWEDLWDKYEAQIVQEECASELEQGKSCLLDREALTKRIYLRILERSCATNQAFDRMFLTNKKKSSENRASTDTSLFPNKATSELGDLDTIAKQLDHDVREILLRPEEQKKMRKTTLKAEKKRIKAEQKAAEQEEKLAAKAAKQQRKLAKKEQKLLAKQKKQQERMGVSVVEAQPPETDDDETAEEVEEYDNETKRAQYNVLRIAANTRRKFRNI